MLTYCDLYDGDRRQASERLADLWPKLPKSDVFGLPSAKLDALLLRAHVRRRADRTITRTLGLEGKAHGRFVAAWAARDSERARAASTAFALLRMSVWSDLAAAYAGEMSVLPRLREAGVRDPERWLGIVAPQAK